MYQVIRGGCRSRHGEGFLMSRPEGLSNYLLLLVHVESLFVIGEREYKVSPGEVLLIGPGTGYSYQSLGKEYRDDWLHFDVLVPPGLPGFYPQVRELLNRSFPAGRPELFSSLIGQILWEASYGEGAFQEENIDCLFTLLMNHLIRAYEQKNIISELSAYQGRLQALRLELQDTLWEQHSIQEYAKRLGISESYFQHLYTECFGISFQQDLIAMRVENAKYMLSTTDLTNEQIALQCGYNNEIHFYRQFKVQTGMTPGRYRSFVNTPASFGK